MAVATRREAALLGQELATLRATRAENATLAAIRGDPARIFQASGMTPDAWQTTLLRSTFDRVLICASRQVGKSQTSSALALKTALLDAGATVLLLSPTLRQSAELFGKVMSLYRDLGRPVPTEQPKDNALRLQLANGSRVISLPGTEATIRGYSAVRLLVIDEAARVPDSLYYSVRPMLAVSGGSLVCVSSAYAKSGFFYSEWVGSNRWERVKVKATDCPRISPEFLEEERRAIGERWFNMEYMAEFSEAIDAVFREEDIAAALDEDLQPLFVEGGR